MSEEFKNSNFSVIIQFAITRNRDQIIKNLFTIREYITDDLSIINTDNIEILELVVRTLIFLDMETQVLNSTIKVLNCPEEDRNFTEWFIKFFGYLESADPYYHNKHYVLYPPNREHVHVFSDGDINLDEDENEWLFGYEKLNVEFI